MKIRVSPLFIDVVWVVLMTLFAGYALTDLLIDRGATIWDTVFFYSIFWNQMDSLAKFGEPAWWFPGNQFGWPAFYYSMLGDMSCATPIFAIVGAVVWLLGRLDIQPSYYALFTAYYGFIVPGLVNLAGYFVLRQLLNSRLAIALAIALSAFSPGTFANMSDIGFLEPLAYSLFFFGCWMQFLRNPGTRNFWLLALSVALLAMDINYPFLMWNIYFVPAGTLLAIFGVPQGWTRFTDAMKKPRSWEWGVAGGLVGLCAVPSFLAFKRGGDFIRTTLATESYDFRNLRIGNPWEMFGIGLPSLGFDWGGEGATRWTMLAAGEGGQWTAYHYMGLMCLPLAITAWIYGKTWMRRNVVIMVLLSGAIICFSAASPIFNILIRSVKALQANNHWSDLGFRIGTYQLFILSAAMGFELLVNGHRGAIRFFPRAMFVSFIFSLAVYWVYYGPSVFGLNIFGLLVTLSILILVVALWLRAYHSQRRRRATLVILLILTVVDLSTFLALHMKMCMDKISHKVVARTERTDEGSVGLARMAPYGTADYADHILKLVPHFHMVEAGLVPWGLWQYTLFNAAHLAEDAPLNKIIETEKQKLTPAAIGSYHSLLLDRSVQELPGYERFLKSPGSPVQGSLKVEQLTYNNLHLKVETSQPAILFIRDAYYPDWVATVNGQPAPIARALLNSKAIVVPQGVSEVKLRFVPRAVAWTLLVAYLIVIGLFINCIFLFSKKAPSSRKRRT